MHWANMKIENNTRKNCSLKNALQRQEVQQVILKHWENRCLYIQEPSLI